MKKKETPRFNLLFVIMQTARVPFAWPLSIPIIE
jgi:hypothetical protein